jgi:hypothetical protein
MTHIGKEERESVTRMHEAGFSDSHIAATFEISVTAVKMLTKRFHVRCGPAEPSCHAPKRLVEISKRWQAQTGRLV